MTATQRAGTDRGLAADGGDTQAVLAVRLPRRRRWGVAAVGVVLVAGGAVAAYLLYTTAGVSRPYLVVAHTIPAGASISAADLQVVRLNPTAQLRSIPAAEHDQVVGQHAVSRLFAGTLLTREELTAQSVPAPGQQLVGVELKPGQVPTRALHPGDPVELVVVPADTVAGPAGVSPPAAPAGIAATMASAAVAETNGNVRVDVVVTAADGPTVASMAAAGRIVLVVTTRG